MEQSNDGEAEKRRVSDLEYHFLRLTLAEKILVPNAERGELWAIQNLLLLVSEAIAAGAVLTPRVANFVSKALKKIHDGEMADRAFGIKRKKGERDTRRSSQRAYSMTDAIERMRHYDGVTLEKAVEVVAQLYLASEDTVKKNWKANHKEVKRIMGLEQDSFGKVNK